MRRERGSVLVLMPVGVLVVMVLGSLALDRAIVFGAQRELVATAQAAANDAAAAGVDLDQLHRDGTVRYDQRRIDRAVAAACSSIDGTETHTWTVRGGVVVVRIVRSVHLVFAGAIPGADDAERVTATASARLMTS